MKLSNDERKIKIEAVLTKYGQNGLLNFYDELDEKQKEQLLSELEGIDFELMKRLYSKTFEDVLGNDSFNVEPIKATVKTDYSEKEEKRIFQLGINEISKGKMAALTMAGGQGTRLGHTGPKGTFDIGLPSHKSLFEIQCYSLKQVSDVSGCIVPWYIMTSHINHEDTVAFFEKNDYFGYGKENVFFFRQTMIPAVDIEGHLLLENKFTVLKSPNGNGGLFESAKSAGIFKHMREKGIQEIFVCGIDNCLVKMADPMFLGYFKDSGMKAVAKSFIKRTADEKAAVFCKKNGKPYVIEYTEISEELANMKDENGVWVYGDSNVLNYIFDIDAAQKLAEEGLSYHIAIKKLNAIDFKTGCEIQIPKGYKFELFLFDAFSGLDDLGVFRIEREEEFAPVKNPTGIDSAESAREMYMKIHKEEIIK